MAAIKHDGEALKFTSANLNRKREIVMTVANQNGWSLEFASEDL